jgi:hypothetical protein
MELAQNHVHRWVQVLESWLVARNDDGFGCQDWWSSVVAAVAAGMVVVVVAANELYSAL